MQVLACGPRTSRHSLTTLCGARTRPPAGQQAWASRIRPRKSIDRGDVISCLCPLCLFRVLVDLGVVLRRTSDEMLRSAALSGRRAAVDRSLRQATQLPVSSWNGQVRAGGSQLLGTYVGEHNSVSSQGWCMQGSVACQIVTPEILVLYL
jgi:hypothetical protein